MNRKTVIQGKQELRLLINSYGELLKNRSNKSTPIIGRLRKQIVSLILKLKKHLTEIELQRVVALPTFCFVIGNFSSLHAQTFDNQIKNPFGLTAGIQFSIPVSADIDADGDPDMFVLSYQGDIRYYKNKGNAKSPEFDQKIDNPFNIGRSGYLGGMSFADLDSDGDLDFLVGSNDGNFWFYRNDGKQSEPLFANKQVNPFGLQAVSYYCFPTFVDLDADGDFDILAFEEYGVVKYFENTGTASAPAFADPKLNPFGLKSTIDYALSPTFADIDEDGDFDLMVGDFYSANFTFFQNTGTATKPAFAQPVLNPFDLTSSNTEMLLPHFTDLDGDGDFDLITGEDKGDIFVYRNITSTNGLAQFQQDIPTISPNPVINVVRISNSAQFNSLEIVTGLGETIMHLNMPTEVLSLSELKPGIYFLRLKMKDESVVTHKLIKL